MRTPSVVPVAIRSPGSSVKAVERYSICSKMFASILPVFDDWRSSPLTRQRTSRACGSEISSAVTIQGHVGPWLSKDFPIVKVEVWEIGRAEWRERGCEYV